MTGGWRRLRIVLRDKMDLERLCFIFFFLGLPALLGVARAAWGLSHSFSAFVAWALAILMQMVFPISLIVIPISAFSYIAKKESFRWARWPAALAALLVVSLVYLAAEKLPVVGWRLLRMQSSAESDTGADDWRKGAE